MQFDHRGLFDRVAFLYSNNTAWLESKFPDGFKISEDQVPRAIMTSSFVVLALVYYLVRYYFLNTDPENNPDWVTRTITWSRENFSEFLYNVRQSIRQRKQRQLQQKGNTTINVRLWRNAGHRIRTTGKGSVGSNKQ